MRNWFSRLDTTWQIGLTTGSIALLGALLFSGVRALWAMPDALQVHDKNTTSLLKSIDHHLGQVVCYEDYRSRGTDLGHCLLENDK